MHCFVLKPMISDEKIIGILPKNGKQNEKNAPFPLDIK